MRVLIAGLLSGFPLLLTLVALGGAAGPARIAAPLRENVELVAPDPLSAFRGAGAGAGDDDDDDDDDALVRRFESDPLVDGSAIVAGAALDRLTWNDGDDPAFPGDVPGSLSAVYDASLPAGLFGFRLPTTFDQDDPFTAVALFVIDPATFAADPNGFFQISWGLWNTGATGLNRTGSFASFASDSFEVIEFAWFPNASAFFGGPFLAPTVLGIAAGDPPDAFANGAFLFDLEAALPLGLPLLAVLEHRPGDDALVAQVYRVVESGRVVPVNGAAGVTRLDLLPNREYAVDAVGLMLWNDGFGGATPAVVANLTFHGLAVWPGAAPGPGLAPR